MTIDDDSFVADPSMQESEAEPTQESLRQKLKTNIIPAITVALVSVPLSSALAMASGSTPMHGLTTAIYGPAIQGLIGGSNYNILGPAGALVNILNKYAVTYGAEIIPILAIVGGIISLFVYLFKLEKYCMLIPVSVLEGFSLSVAISIGFGQFTNALGLKNLPVHPEFYLKQYEVFANIG